ncbi:MAG: orotidine-5'-phosphate decarboxylase [Actinomycetota bacterium]|nr:orotidine-5'-phosphate decarboxylase [Actinomycetota bacterium]MDQ3574614.1 orotidine-5'-phosphate decarboxylase [Actinomycetota bacterium]
MTDLRERKEADIRNRLAIALDVDDLVEASRIAREVRPWFGVAKVGLVLYTAAGPDAVVELMESGYRVMVDLKLHDIPSHVRLAARVVGGLGASYLTLHASGGVSMLRGGVEGLADGAAMAGLEPPSALAVTVLTSDAGAPSHVLGNRVRAAVEAGCRGIVCAAGDVREARQLAPRIVTVVPGIRLPNTNNDDQARASAPQSALDAGADLLVVGRAVTAASDRAQAAAEVVGSLTLERRRA